MRQTSRRGAARQVDAGATARRRRDGSRVRRAPQDRATRRDQDLAPRVRAVGADPRALRTRSARAQSVQASGRGRGARSRDDRRWRSIHRDGVARRRAVVVTHPQDAAVRRRCASRGRRSARRARRGARAEHHSSRHQAGQFVRAAERRDQSARFRHRASARGREELEDEDRNDARHRGVHAAGAAQGARHRSTRGHLRRRRDDVPHARRRDVRTTRTATSSS